MQQEIIRAQFDKETITVYQAYNNAIATPAVSAQTFISPPFKKSRMTWIKPSFLWMMYRSGWATKENQEQILAIKVSRKGFEWALQNSCLSSFDKTKYSSYEEWKMKLNSSPVRIQWDPEKDIFLNNLPYKSIQIGLSESAVNYYINEWIIKIENITSLVSNINEATKKGDIVTAMNLLPKEDEYPLAHINL